MTKRSTTIGKHTILLIASLFVIIPVVYLISTSLKSMSEMLMAQRATLFPEEFTFTSYLRIWFEYPFGTYLKNSLIVSVGSTVISLIFSTLGAYGFSRFKFRGHGFLLLFILTTQMFPSVMLFVPYYKLLSIYKLTNSYMGLSLVYVANTIPFCTWLMYGYFNSISTELDAAARIDGCGRFRTFWNIILPLALPCVVSTTIYAFVQSWNEYMFAMIFTNSEEMKTIPLAIGQMANAYEVYYNDLMAASVFASVPLVLLFVFLQRYFISGMTGGAVKG